MPLLSRNTSHSLKMYRKQILILQTTVFGFCFVKTFIRIIDIFISIEVFELLILKIKCTKLFPNKKKKKHLFSNLK